MSDLSVHGGPTLTPVTHSNKAVAVGAVLFYVDHFVTGRISKFTYGVLTMTPYQSSNREHVRRKDKLTLDAAGDWYVTNHFASMLLRVRHPLPFLLLFLLNNSVTLQGAKVLEDRELRYHLTEVTKGTPRKPISLEVTKYTGTGNAPEWTDIEPGNMFSSENVVRGAQVEQISL